MVQAVRVDLGNRMKLRLQPEGVTSLAPLLARGVQGPPGPGSAAWTAVQAVSTGTVRQAPDGSWIRSVGARTTRATFDATEAGFWTAVLGTPGTIEADALAASYAAYVTAQLGDLNSAMQVALAQFYEQVVTPERHGAVGDGVADDTAAVQAALDEAIGGTVAAGVGAVRTPTKAVFLPKKYLTTVAPKAYSVFGLHVYGSGMNSGIIVSGSRTYGIDLNGCAKGLFENFDVWGATSADIANKAIGVNWDPAVSASSSYGTVFRGVHVRNLKFIYGFSFGQDSADRDVSGISAYDCRVDGKDLDSNNDATYWQAGFVSGSGTIANVLDHALSHPTVTFCKWGIWQNACTLRVTAAASTGNLIDLRQTGNRYLRVDSWRSETSGRFFIQDGAAGYAAQAHFGTVTFECNGLNADSEIMQLNYSGVVEVDNFYISPWGRVPVIRTAATNGLALTIHNAEMTAAVDALIVNTAGKKASVVITNYMQMDDTTTPVLITPIYVKGYGTIAAAQVAYFDRIKSAAFTADSTAAGGNQGVYWGRNATNKWELYVDSGGDSLFLRDLANSRMLLTFSAGATANTSQLKVDAVLWAAADITLGSAADAPIQRVAAGMVNLGKLSVSNAAAATTPGSVVKKIEVFDAAGSSLGYVPVYSAIT